MIGVRDRFDPLYYNHGDLLKVSIIRNEFSIMYRLSLYHSKLSIFLISKVSIFQGLHSVYFYHVVFSEQKMQPELKQGVLIL